jgi:hypothetical protein
MYFSSLSGTFKAVIGRLCVKKRPTLHDHHIDHFGRLILKFRESVQHQPGEAARTLSDYVLKARPSSGCAVIELRYHSSSRIIWYE